MNCRELKTSAKSNNLIYVRNDIHSIHTDTHIQARTCASHTFTVYKAFCLSHLLPSCFITTPFTHTHTLYIHIYISSTRSLFFYSMYLAPILFAFTAFITSFNSTQHNSTRLADLTVAIKEHLL